MLSTIFDRLVLYKEKGDKTFKQQVIRYHPDKGYLEKNKYDVSHIHLYHLEGFSGYLEYLTIEGVRKGVVRVVNGRPVKRYFTGAARPARQTKEKGPDSKNMVTSSGGWECYEVCEDIILEVCAGGLGDPDDPDDEYCEEQVIGQECDEYCDFEDDDFPDFCDDPANWNDGGCGGGGGGGDPYPDPEPEGPEEIDLSFCAGISPTDRTTIENSLEEAASQNCATLKVNNALAGLQGLTLGMCVDEINGKDTYSVTTKTITFQTSYTADRSDVMMHELFHAYQDNVAYPGGISAYGTDASTNIKQPGFSNIEFEQALFRDIMMLHGSSATALYFSSDQTIKDDYKAWINTLTSNGTQYPDFSTNWSAYETKYFEFMEEFKSNPRFDAPIINTLEPEALKNIFNGLQPNCGN